MGKKKIRINHQVKNNFEHYENLVCGSKKILSENLYLSTKPSNVLWDLAKSNVIHSVLPNTIEFRVEINKSNKDDFKFSLTSSDLTNEPFFRFDSDGAAHQNRNEREDLVTQQITTPHFQKFNKNGLSIAYKTDQLKDEITCKILQKDVNLCMIHFCHESNSRYSDDNFPQIDFSYNTINFSFPDDSDPLKGVQF